MQFYLGTHESSWLGRVDFPLFVSHRRLAPRRSLPRAKGRWALDSGGFTELSMFGGWRTSEAEYLDAVNLYQQEIGGLDWAAPMDWMCEPSMLERTGLSIEEHQERTVGNYLRLRESGLPFIPVLQGWSLADYQRCVELYRKAGVALDGLVGLGSVCRRQDTTSTLLIVLWLASQGIRPHGFGIKLGGLRRYGYLLASADSMAWSYRARRSPALPECKHRNCNSCLRFAQQWRRGVLESLAYQQPHLPGMVS